MDVQMVYFLPAFIARVGHDAKATVGVGVATLLQRQPGGQQQHASQEGFVVGAGVGERRNVQLGHHQKVHRGPRVDVVKGVYVVVFVNLAAGNFSDRNFAKQAIFINRHVHSSIARPAFMRRKPLAMRYKNQMDITHQATMPGNRNNNHSGKVTT
jgi:hypothetical protein